ncbi:hypothetical protein [uncultured Kocuria sp.]|uniref:hypothetical protein n=1 Tax=uncultured Kocuria sp. TaxID=259305 RepID=UPI00259659B0|nr:hypothetical protein [uncultured Kocuria sp.]
MNSTLVHEELSPYEAQSITDQIRSNLTSTYQLIQRAWEQRAWIGMGYESWDAYVHAEFADMSLTPPLERRTAEVASMAEAGMSVRAIGTATGMGKSSVARSLKEAESQGLVSKDRETSTGLDGKKRPAHRPQIEVDDSILDSPVEDLGVGLVETQQPPESHCTTEPATLFDAGPKRVPDVELSKALSAAKSDIVSAEESVKAAIQTVRSVPLDDLGDVDSDLIARLVSAVLAEAGLLDVLGLSRVTVPEHEVRAKHLQVAATTLDRVCEQLGGDERE